MDAVQSLLAVAPGNAFASVTGMEAHKRAQHAELDPTTEQFRVRMLVLRYVTTNVVRHKALADVPGAQCVFDLAAQDFPLAVGVAGEVERVTVGAQARGTRQNHWPAP